MKSELITITPNYAATLLETHNAGNRPLSQAHVQFLAKEIKMGRWKVNGDTICINDEKLVDGQHRLAAVVMAQIPIQTFVVFGISSDVFDTKDVGKRRSNGDTLGCLGNINTYRLAAMLTIVEKYYTGKPESTSHYSNTEIEAILKKYPDAPIYVGASRSGKLIPPSLLDACHYIFSKSHAGLAKEFVESLTTGKGLDGGQPFYVLRERLVVNLSAKAKLSKSYIFALCIKAWNYTKRGQCIRCLRYSEIGNAKEQFPIVE